MSVKMRQIVEREITGQVVDSLLEAGYELGVNDGEETTIRHNSDAAKIKSALMTTDEDWLLVYENEDDSHHSWVRFIYGNDGYDVINDYTTDLEPVIGEGTKTQKLIDKYSD